MNRRERAISHFREGYNCAQSVLMACAGESGAMARAAAAFGGGMGRLQGTCGAVTGAYIWFGMAYAQDGQPAGEEKEKLYERVREFNRIFVDRNGSERCSELLGEDLSTPDGRSRIARKGLTKKVCEKCITDAIEIIDLLADR